MEARSSFHSAVRFVHQEEGNGKERRRKTRTRSETGRRKSQTKEGRSSDQSDEYMKKRRKVISPKKILPILF